MRTVLLAKMREGKEEIVRRNNVNYEIECQLCPEERSPVYIGEISKNVYTRTKEHMRSENRVDAENDEPCFARRHCAVSPRGNQQVPC